VTLGWAKDPLYAWVNESPVPVVHDLMHLDGAFTYRKGAVVGTVDATLRAVWNGEVGIGNPRVGVAVTGPRTYAAARFTVPFSGLDNPLSVPTSVLDVNAGYAGQRWSASACVSVRPDRGDEWQSSVTGLLGIQPMAGWTLEAKGEYLLSGSARVEAGSSINRRFGAFKGSLGLVVGITDTPATPRFRVLLGGSWGKRPKAETPIPVPELPTAPPVSEPELIIPVVQTPPFDEPPVEEAPIEAPEVITPPVEAPAPPLDRKYDSVMDAAAGYFLAHPEVRFIVETNGSRKQAEQVVEELRRRGIVKERVVRIDVVKRKGAVVFEFIVVAGQGE
jgi:hypothetical protein